MQIYLPIAEVSVNAFLLLGLGGFVGILSGMFGVGGGIITVPVLVACFISYGFDENIIIHLAIDPLEPLNLLYVCHTHWAFHF